MEVLSILPTPVAIIPCPFADKVKATVMEHLAGEDYNKLGYNVNSCLLYTSPSPRDRQKSRMPSSA